jgi:hypothetical protein
MPVLLASEEIDQRFDLERYLRQKDYLIKNL